MNGIADLYAAVKEASVQSIWAQDDHGVRNLVWTIADRCSLPSTKLTRT
jgi:hypothetical protein